MDPFKDVIEDKDFDKKITVDLVDHIFMKRRSDLWIEVVNLVSRGIFTNHDLELLKKHKRLRKDYVDHSPRPIKKQKLKK